MNDTIRKLGARALANSSSKRASLVDVEKKLGITFPISLSTLLGAFDGAIVFENGALFAPKIRTGREGLDGNLSLNVLYGCHLGGDGLIDQNLMLSEQLPSQLVAIGESSGGDQVCIRKGKLDIFYWKHDSEENAGSTRIADDFETFLNSLRPDESPRGHREIDEDSSFLDF